MSEIGQDIDKELVEGSRVDDATLEEEFDFGLEDEMVADHDEERRIDGANPE